MSFTETVKRRRTIRKFENKEIDLEILKDLVDSARLAPYPVNLQPLKFMIIRSNPNSLFKYTKWAGLLKDSTPKENERPKAYIAVIGDKSIKKSDDFSVEGAIACTTMSYAAEFYGLGSCWLGAIDKSGIKAELSLDDKYEVVYLLALGYPAQKSRITEYSGSTSYYEQDGEIRVPKRSVDDVLLSERI